MHKKRLKLNGNKLQISANLVQRKVISVISAPRDNLESDPLAILHLDNQLFMCVLNSYWSENPNFFSDTARGHGGSKVNDMNTLVDS